MEMEHLESHQNEQKPPQQGQFLVDFMAILRVYSGHFWYKEEQCEDISGFQSPRIADQCFRNDLRWLYSYQKPQVLQEIAIYQQLRVAGSFSEMAI